MTHPNTIHYIILNYFLSLIISAFSTYKTALAGGDDGKPNWMARKSCNYVQVAVEDCTNLLLGDCYSQKEVDNMKSQQLKGILSKIETEIDEWDSSLCPLVR